MKTKSPSIVVISLLSFCFLSSCGRTPSPTGDSALEVALGGAALENASNASEIENFVASCMKQQGFTYKPYVMPAQPVRTLDQVTAEGFGITIDSRSRPRQLDPNQIYFDSLSTAEANRFTLTLSGLQDAKFLRDAGCRGAAQSRYLPEPEFAIQINALLDAMDKELRRDPQYVLSMSVYKSCMGTKGFKNKDGATLRAEFAKAVDRGEPLSDLQNAERSAARADFECQSEHDKAVRKARAKYESDFLRQNAEIVEQAMKGRLGR